MERITRNINKHTISSFCKILKTTKWTNVINSETPKLAFDSFFETFNPERDMAYPEIVAKPKSNKFSHSPWMTPGLRVSQKRKEKLFAEKIRNPSELSKHNINNIIQFIINYAVQPKKYILSISSETLAKILKQAQNLCIDASVDQI